MDNQKSVCIVGAGFSGICSGIKLKTKLGFDNFTIFDENNDFGGTWLLHTYPKCGCDVPSIFYSFSFEQNPGWSSVYCKQVEILEYLKNLATKHDLYSNAKFGYQIQALIWIPHKNKWKVRVLNKSSDVLEEFLYDIIIAGPGGLRIPNVPDEYTNFKGPVIHSAVWDNSIDLKGKVVAVVGSGTSAVQIIPGIVDNVKKLVSFQRRPAWVFPKPQAKFGPSTQSAFRKVPGVQKIVRNSVFWAYESGYLAFKKDSIMNAIATQICKMHMKRQIPSNPELRKKLTPDYPFACKRIAPSNAYFPALNKPNVEVIREKIDHVSENSLVTEDGKEYQVDVVILATGYKVKDYFAPVKIFLSEQENSTDEILEPIRNTPSHYLGIMLEKLPNFFLLMGPNSAVAHSSCIFPIECQMNWIVKVLKKMESENCSTVQVTKSAVEKYMAKLLKDLEGTVYGAYDCGAWFKDSRGIITALNSGSLVDYWRKSRKVNFDNLKFK